MITAKALEQLLEASSKLQAPAQRASGASASEKVSSVQCLLGPNGTMQGETLMKYCMPFLAIRNTLSQTTNKNLIDGLYGAA